MYSYNERMRAVLLYTRYDHSASVGARKGTLASGRRYDLEKIIWPTRSICSGSVLSSSVASRLRVSVVTPPLLAPRALLPGLG